jgi:oligosaccharide repeat unit polymerase
MLPLTYSIKRPALATIFYISLSLAMFTAGIALANMIRGEKSNTSISVPRYQSYQLRYVWAGYAASLALYTYEMLVFAASYGNVPIFLSNYETLRFELGVNGYLHALAICGRMLLLVPFVFLMENRLTHVGKITLISSFLATACLDILSGNRGQVIIFAFLFLVVYSFYRRSILATSVLGVGAALLIGAGKTIRELNAYGPDSIISVGRDWTLGTGFLQASMYHLYTAFSYNLAVLDRYVIASNDRLSYGYWSFFQGIWSLIPGDQYTLVDFQRDVLGIRFHGVLTSTVLGSPFFDFGYFGCLVLLLLGYVSQRMYLNAKASRDPFIVCGSALINVYLFVGIYSYVFSQFHVLMNFAILLFVAPLIMGWARRKPRSGQTAGTSVWRPTAR